MVLSPTKGFVEKHKVLVARIHVEAQPLKTVPLRIFNPGNSAVTIKNGAVAPSCNNPANHRDHSPA